MILTFSCKSGDQAAGKRLLIGVDGYGCFKDVQSYGERPFEKNEQNS